MGQVEKEGRQREFLLLLRLTDEQPLSSAPGEAMQLGKVEKSVCSLYLLSLQSQCLTEFPVAVGPLAHPPLWSWAPQVALVT